MELPKILIIGQPFNNDTGGGITLSNLFKGWDRDKLAVTCSGYFLLDNIDTEVCNTYYQLGEKENKWVFPFNYLQRRYPSGLIQFSEKKIQNLTLKKSKFRNHIIEEVFLPFIRYIGLLYFVNRTMLSKDYCRWLDQYKPDVLYIQATSLGGIRFCRSVQTYLKKPMILHVMDDWPSTLNRRGLFNKYWQRKIDRELRILMDQSTLLMSISDEMANEYKIRYHKDFITFHNTIDIEFWKRYQRKNYDLNENPTILYAGRIGLGIDSSLELFAKAIEGINEELKLSIKFIIQTQEKPMWIKNYRNVIHNSFVSYNDLPKVFAESDLLLLPYDFSPESIKFIKYSMPTKVPEYMITGSPIIIFAPEETAIVNYAKKYAWAKIITRNDILEVSNAIKQLIMNKDIREKYAINAINIAENNYDSTEVTTRFRNVIISTVDN